MGQEFESLQVRHFMVDIVQLVRASVCGTECRGFESHYPPHFFLKRIWTRPVHDYRINMMGYSQVGKASDFDSDIRKFKSCHPSQIFLDGPLAQSVEHLTFNQGVPSSNLGWTTTCLSQERYKQAEKFSASHGRLAQLVEQLTLNQWAQGSSP